MKYTIYGFSQKEALNFRKTVVDKNGSEKEIKVDCIDLLILRWFVDFYPKMIKVEIEGEQYAWVKYQSILEDLPLLDIKKQALFDRLKKLCAFDILKHKTIKVDGTFSYYGFGKMYNCLIDTESSQTNTGDYSNNEGVCSQIHTGVYSTKEQINTSIKDNSIKNNKINNNTIESEFEKLWQLYPRKIGKPKALKSYQKARKNGTAYEEVLQGINAYIKQIEANKTKTEYIKHGSTWFNGQCWLDEYEVKQETPISSLPFDESKYTL